jgi:putative hemolysin
MAFLIIILLITLNGYFALAEIALISVNNTDLEDELNKNNHKAAQVQKLIKDPEEFLSAIEVGTTLLGLLEGIYGGGLVAERLDHWFLLLGMSSLTAHVAALLIGIGTITYLTLVFGVLVPMSIALQMPLKISLALAPSLLIIHKVLYPFVKILTKSTRFILSALSIKRANNKQISEKDIKGILGAAYKQGLLGKQQFSMHENLFAFNDLKAKNIMKPARIIICISYDLTREEVTREVREHPYSNFPVYEGEPGHIVGVLHVKAFFLDENAEWHKSIDYNCSVNPDAAVRDVFNTFKEKKIKFGIVLNDAKKFMGVIAMQDIMEGVFGDIPELEDYTSYFYQKSTNVWIAENFIHLQRIRNTLDLSWLRHYEAKYLSLSDLFAGESALLTNDGTITLSGVSFKIISGTPKNPQTIEINLSEKNK